MLLPLVKRRKGEESSQGNRLLLTILLLVDSKAYAINSHIYGVTQKTELLGISKAFHLKLK